MSEIQLADRLASLAESATLALNARAKQLAAEGKTIYNLTAGELATDTPDYIQAAVALQLHHNKYTPVAGLPQLREAIATNAQEFYGLDWIEASNVVVTAGAKPALYASLLAMLNPGDEVIVPTPAWVSYSHLIELAGGKVIEVPLTEAFDIDATAIKAKLSSKTKAIIVNSPHNPTGSVFSKAALTDLAGMLKGKKVTLIADDIYAKLVYDDKFTLVPSYGFERLIIISGFSKSQALTGWRIGYAIADTHTAHGITGLLSHMMGNAPLPSQHAALVALERDDQPPAETLYNLIQHRQICLDSLNEIPRLKYHAPGGAFYIFIDLRSITDDSAAWCEELLIKTGVAIVPGEAFRAPGFARLSFVTDIETLKEGLSKLKIFVTAIKPGVAK